MIGVLGGMGPLATLDFFSKVLAATPVQGDADHVPLLIQSDPRIPPRPPAIVGHGRSPLPELLAGRDRLIAAGATALAMPCNTAHFWYADLLTGCPVPFISIVDVSVAELVPLAYAGAPIGIIATRATLAARIFDAPLTQAGYTPLLPDADVMDALVLPGIDLVKAGRAAEGGQLIEQAVQALLNQGAGAVVLACTETPLALDAVQSPLRAKCVDSTAALARACVAWWQANQGKTE
ncbi:amino acid racemase [Polaromonas sp. YR568]|uniref:aspartate/glutamate racemase family protein n=1 Tax=Polaromonas sp. YR568 TaxID=1855301 RepID=UPI003137AA4B